MKLTRQQFVAFAHHPRLGSSVEIEVDDSDGSYHFGLLYAELKGEFLAWCKENGIRALLM